MEDKRIYIVAIFSTLSLLLSLYSLWVGRKKERKAQQFTKSKAVLDLHQQFWEKDFWVLGHDVGRIVGEWNTTKTISSDYLIAMREVSDVEVKDNRRKIGRLGHFFADINVMLDEDLLCEKTVYRLFGESQLYWFLPYFYALEVMRVEKGQEFKPAWFAEVRALDDKLKKYRKFT